MDDGCIHPVFEGLLPFPSDQLATADSTSPTGIRLHLDPAMMPLTRKGAPSIEASQLEGVDGFSRIAPMIVGLTEYVDPETIPVTSEDVSAPFLLMKVETGEVIPSRIAVTADGMNVTVWPDKALDPASRYATVTTSSVPASSCFSAGPEQKEREAAGDDFAKEMDEAREAATAAGASVVSVTPFTTRSLEGEERTMMSLREQVPGLVSASSLHFDTVANCSTDAFDGYCGTGVGYAAVGTADLPTWQTSTGPFEIAEDGSPVPQGTEAVHFWLMTPAVPSHGLIVFQHGLGSRKEDLRGLARHFVEQGYSAIAIDAVKHGERPHKGDVTTLFFGIELDRWYVEGARDNVRQTASDHLALVQVLQDYAPDGHFPEGFDLNLEDVSYVGQSLGGIIGSNSCALNPEIDRCVLNVPGGRLVEIIRANGAYSALLGIYFDLTAQYRDLELFTALAQSVVDDGDPALVGARILANSPARPLLVQEATYDDTVPNQTTEAMARSIGLPLLNPSYEEIRGLELQDMPAQDNVETGDGPVTAGLTQFRDIHGFLTSEDDEAQRAIQQILGFLGEGAVTEGN